MKANFICFFICIFIFIGSFSNNVYCQDELPPMDELRVPNSPAFNLLGISPNAVNRPATPKAFMLSILDSTADSEGDFPKNLAVEFSPYWWLSHPKLTFEDFYDKTSFGESILETLSISLGTTESKINKDGSEIDVTKLGVGLRFNLISGKAAPGLYEKVKEFREIQEKDCLEFIPVEGEVSESQLMKCASLKEKANEIAKYNKNRVGWQLEFASAITYELPENDWDKSDFSRFGSWLTGSYKSTEKDSVLHQFSFLSIGRYIHEDKEDENDDIFDLGASIVWNSNELPLSLSLEYLHRFTDEDDERLVGILEYIVNDTYSIFASYGKTFDGDFKGDEDLFAIFGINFGWGKGPIVK